MKRHSGIHPGWLFVLSLLIFVGAIIVDTGVRCRSVGAALTLGLMNGLFFGGVLWVFVGVPVGLVVLGVYRWQGWHRFLNIMILTPSLCVLAFTTYGLIAHPTTAESRLRKLTGLEFPTSTKDLRSEYFGGGFCDSTDVFFFRCTREDAQKFIQTLKLKRLSPEEQDFYHGAASPDWPDEFRYTGDSENQFSLYYLQTDSTGTQVLFTVHGL